MLPLLFSVDAVIYRTWLSPINVEAVYHVTYRLSEQNLISELARYG